MKNVMGTLIHVCMLVISRHFDLLHPVQTFGSHVTRSYSCLGLILKYRKISTLLHTKRKLISTKL